MKIFVAYLRLNEGIWTPGSAIIRTSETQMTEQTIRLIESRLIAYNDNLPSEIEITFFREIEQ